ncbi:MAG: superoxide dismutase family protein [Acidimicrobiales bacterium]
MRSKQWKAAAVVLSAATAAGGLALFANAASASDFKAVATLRSAEGDRVGRVLFDGRGDHTEVRVRLSGLDRFAVDAFHGFHIHANDVAENGDGCLAKPGEASNTWFVAVDGHWKTGDQAHGLHLGDMPPLLVNDDGTAEARFTTGRFEPAQLAGRAVILHAGPDNLGHVPVGDGPNQYKPNSETAAALTANTGNAGDRIACGVIALRR